MNNDTTKPPSMKLRRQLRFNYKGCCAMCGIPEWKAGRTFHIHRIIGDGAYTLDNCILLCHKCHDKAPGKIREELEIAPRIDEDSVPDIASVIADDKSLVLYRPKLNSLTGSTLATILLQQILYWWNNNGKKPFYKFNGPCDHPAYRQGDSWQEELGFSKTEFTTARDRIASKITMGLSRSEIVGQTYVTYWTDQDRKTWYEVNDAELNKAMLRIYIPKSGILHLENQDSCITKVRNPDLYSPETTTKTTTETTHHPPLADGATAPKPTPPKPKATPKPKRELTYVPLEEDGSPVEGHDPSDLELMLAAAVRAKALTPAQQASLSAPVRASANGHRPAEYPSPEALWSSAVLGESFKEYVGYCVAKAQEHRMSRQKLVGMVRNYGRPGTGWIAWKEGNGNGKRGREKTGRTGLGSGQGEDAAREARELALLDAVAR